MKSKYFLLTASLLYSTISNAITLNEALPLSYKKSDELKAAEQLFIGEIQTMSEAIASFMPRVNAKIDMTNTKVDGAPSVYNNNVQKSQSINVSQPIFSGGTSIAYLKLAQSQFRISRSKYYSTEQKFLLQSIETYLNTYEAQERYKIASDSLDFRAKELEAAEERMKLGEETITGTAAAKAKLYQAQAVKADAFANLEVNKASFKKTFGVEPENIQIPDSPNNIPEDLELFNKKSISSNYDLLQAKDSVAASKSKAYMTLTNLLPDVSLNASISNSKYSEPTRATGQQNNKAVSTSLSINIPIYSKGGAEYAAVRRDNSSARQAAFSLNNTIEAVKVGAINLWEQYNSAKLSLDFTNEAVSATSLALDAAKEEYLVGSKNIIEVFQLEDQLNQAKISSITNKKKFINLSYQISSYIGDATAKALKLKVKYFDPDLEFKKVKVKFIGF